MKRIKLNRLRIVLILMLALGLMLPFSPLPSGLVKAQAVPVKKTILVLSPFQIDLATNLIAAQAMREEFGQATDLSLDVYYEYLDLVRFAHPADQQQVFDLLTTKYKTKPVDLVMISSEAMLKLWLTHRAKILPDTPIVFFDVTTEHLEALHLPENVTGVSGTENCTKSVQWVLDQLPEVNEVVLVIGAGKIEQGFFDHLQALQEKLKARIKFTNLSHLPLAEIKARVAKLPKTSIVLYHPMFEDAEGKKHHPMDVLRELTAVSSVPVLGGYDQFIGTGIIGGYMYNIDQQARDATQISLRILRGEALSSIPIAQNQSDRFVFDHLALQRFEIPLAALPPESLIRNRQYSFWEIYQTQIIFVSAGFLLLILLVVYLSVATRRLSTARFALSQINASLETQVQERTAVLSQTNRDLESEITERKRVETEIIQLNAELEQRVEERARELRETQEQLVRHEKLAVLGQLAGSVGHELRNPLGIINNAIYFLRLVQPEAEASVKEYLGIIESETRTADKIISDLLDFSRIKSVDLEPVQASELIQRTLARYPVPETIQLTLNLPENLPTVYVDPRQMIQVLGNLVQNACQAMADGGQLLVSSDQLSVVSDQSSAKSAPLITLQPHSGQADHWLLITVTDTGVGITPENMKKLFEPLFTTKPKGIGLGLAVSKKLVEANGGRIEVESKIGVGTTFTIYLPLNKKREQTPS